MIIKHGITALDKRFGILNYSDFWIRSSVVSVLPSCIMIRPLHGGHMLNRFLEQRDGNLSS